jgi:hypothetical protein
VRFCEKMINLAEPTYMLFLPATPEDGKAVA